MRTITKTILTIVAILLVGGCTTLTPEEKQKKALRDSVVGEYEHKSDIIDGYTIKYVLLENGVKLGSVNGEKLKENIWKIVDGEIHLDSRDIGVFKINTDRSITVIARIVDGKREEVEYPVTFKKIK